jgi:hypothetical protein
MSVNNAPDPRKDDFRDSTVKAARAKSHRGDAADLTCNEASVDTILADGESTI